VLHSARFGSYDLAWGLYNQGKYREAIRAFEALLNKPGALPDSYRSFVRGGIGWSELALGEVERAEQAFKRIRAATKVEEAEAKSGLGWIALRRNRPEQAENLFAEALSAVPGYNAALLGRAQLRQIRAPELDQAWAAYNQGKFDQAATSFNQIAEHSSLPADYRQEAYSGYAWSLYFRQKFQEAAAAFERLLQGRKTADLFYGRGQALAGLGQHQAAAPFLKRAAELVTYSVEYHLAYGWSLLRGGDSKEALAVFIKAYQLAPASAEVNRSLGWAYARENRAAEAKAAFRYALSLIPGYSDDKEFKELTARKEYKELLNDLGWGYVRWQEFDRARKLFEEITKSDPADSDAWFGHGYTLYKLGKGSEAEKSLDRAIKAKRPAFARTVWVIFPEAGAYPILTDPRSILGWTALAVSKYEQALDRFEGSLNRDPEMVASMVGKAICLARTGQAAEARELYLTAQEIYSTYPSVQAGLKENGSPRTSQAR
jgi:tetratricopeptide (TPR) repeat protein